MGVPKRNNGPRHGIPHDLARWQHARVRERARIAAIRRDARSVFMSGDDSGLTAIAGSLEPSVQLLEKPFTETALWCETVGLQFLAGWQNFFYVGCPHATPGSAYELMTAISPR